MARKLCKIDGCQTIARTGYDVCFKHGAYKICKIEGCKSKAVDGYDKCEKHGRYRKQKICKIEGCKTEATHGYDCCKKHKGGKKCKIEGCETIAQNGYDCCIAHGGGQRCPNCITWIDSRSGWKKYDGYCATCFKQVFPTDPRSTIIYSKSSEMKVRNYLNEHMNGFIHDIPLHTSHCECNHRRRIDHRMLVGNTLIAIETDERQHKGYNINDEEDRYDDLYMAYSGKWIFIRFNPDSYTEKGVRKNPLISKRLPVLLEEIKKQIKRIEKEENQEFVEVIKLYYDN